MVYITGDLHGANELIRFNTEHLSLSVKDTIIQCGDSGIVWYPKTSNKIGEENKWLNWYERSIPSNLLIVLGNHENYHRIYNDYELVNVYDGQAFKIRKNIFMLKDIQVINIEGLRFLTIRGASSIDKAHRIEGYDWWPEEEISYYSMQLLYSYILQDNKYDYVVSHTAPKDIIENIFHFYDNPDRTSNFLNQIYNVIQYKHWYFGHFHKDINFDKKFTCLYKTIERIL